MGSCVVKVVGVFFLVVFLNFGLDFGGVDFGLIIGFVGKVEGGG